MRANTNRDNRLAFDRVAATYDEGRPRFSNELVQSIAGAAGLEPDDQVVEVGAGTGQLTGALVQAGLVVTAIEPGLEMRAILARRFGQAGRVIVSGQDFEDFTSDRTYRAVFAANSFHWLDPAMSHDRAADLLGHEGHLCLVWNYPILPADIQDRLNDSVFRQHPDFAGDETSLLAAVHDSAADGRRQLLASGRFDTPWWQWREEHFELGVDSYVRLLVSYANVAALNDEAHDQLAAEIREELAALRVEQVPVTNHIYAVAAEKTSYVTPPGGVPCAV